MNAAHAPCARPCPPRRGVRQAKDKKLCRTLDKSMMVWDGQIQDGLEGDNVNALHRMVAILSGAHMRICACGAARACGGMAARRRLRLLLLAWPSLSSGTVSVPRGRVCVPSCCSHAASGVARSRIPPRAWRTTGRGVQASSRRRAGKSGN